MNGLAAYTAATPASGDHLVNRYAPLVKRIAHHLMGRLPDTVLAEDLIQAGMIGLLEAARNFDDSQGAAFETYAGIRIRGAMLDEVRRNNWTPRSVHRRARELAGAIQAVEHREGRDARDTEIAEQLGIEVGEYHRILREATGYRLLSLDDTDNDDDPLRERIASTMTGVVDGLQREDLQASVAEAIESLPERERLVMALYYDEEMNLKEIGAVLGVSESRVCQIHGQALLRLRGRLADWSAQGSC